MNLVKDYLLVAISIFMWTIAGLFMAMGLLLGCGCDWAMNYIAQWITKSETTS
jgi:hypothetical protein